MNSNENRIWNSLGTSKARGNRNWNAKINAIQNDHPEITSPFVLSKVNPSTDRLTRFEEKKKEINLPFVLIACHRQHRSFRSFPSFQVAYPFIVPFQKVHSRPRGASSRCQRRIIGALAASRRREKRRVDRHIGGGPSPRQSATERVKRGCGSRPIAVARAPPRDHHTHECHVRTSSCNTVRTVVRVPSCPSHRSFPRFAIQRFLLLLLLSLINDSSMDR